VVSAPTTTAIQSVDDLMPRARELAAGGRVPAKASLQKSLGVGWSKAVEVHLRLTAEADAERDRRRDERRAKMSKLRVRKTPAVRIPARVPALPEAPVPPTVESIPANVDPVPDTPSEDFGSNLANAVEPSPGVSRTPSTRSLVGLVLSAALVVVGSVWLAGPGRALVVDSASWALAGAAALAVLAVLAGSLTSVVRNVFAGRTGRDMALDVASWTVAGVAGFLAAYGQVRFAEWAGVTGNMRFLVPGILEPSVVVLLLLANRRVKRRRAGFPAKPIGKLLSLAALLGGFAVYTNVVHSGGKAGLVFGAATVVGLVLWWVKLQDDAAPDDWDDDQHSKRLSRKTSRYRLLRWLILFSQTRRAWLISLDHSVSDAELGLELARRWRRAYDSSRALKSSRRVSRRVATAHIDQYLLDEQDRL
jgi:hypothetical protein